MKEKKMVFAAPFPPHGGGIANYSAQALCHLRSHIEILPLGFSKVFPGKRFRSRQVDSMEEIERPFSGYLPSGWRIPSTSTDEIEPFLLLIPSWTVWLVPAMTFIVRSFNRKFRGCPVMIWCHNVTGHGESRLTTHLYRHLYNRADYFLTQSAEETRKLAALGYPEEKILTSFLPLHPVDSSFTREEARRLLNICEKRHLLFFGALRPYKGLDTLADAWQILPPQWRSETRLTLAGEAWSGVEGAVAKLEESGAVLLEGYQTEEEAGKLFASADAVVLPYREATGSGILMMAYSAGVPSVVSRLPSLMDYLEDGRSALTFTPGDPEDLAQTILSLFVEGRLEELRDGIASISNRYSWEEWSRQFLSFLRQKGIINE